VKKYEMLIIFLFGCFGIICGLIVGKYFDNKFLEYEKIQNQNYFNSLDSVEITQICCDTTKSFVKVDVNNGVITIIRKEK
jgi:hypothetical protein